MFIIPILLSYLCNIHKALLFSFHKFHLLFPFTSSKWMNEQKLAPPSRWVVGRNEIIFRPSFPLILFSTLLVCICAGASIQFRLSLHMLCTCTHTFYITFLPSQAITWESQSTDSNGISNNNKKPKEKLRVTHEQEIIHFYIKGCFCDN